MENKKLILDYSKWRSGAYGSHQLGQGDTKMRNIQGYECCLGQFCTQLSPEVENKLKSNDIGTPFGLSSPVPILTFKSEYNFNNTPISNSAMAINDDSNYTVNEKIHLLTCLFGMVGYEIEVINKPQ